MKKPFSSVLKGCAAAILFGIVLCIVGAAGGGKATLYPDWKSILSLRWSFIKNESAQLSFGAAQPGALYSLNLSCDAAEVALRKGKEFEVHTNREDLVSAKLDDGTFTVSCVQSGIIWDSDEVEITVTVPENAQFDEALLSLDAGKLKAEDLSFGQLTCEVGAGTAELKKISVSGASSLHVGVGKLEADRLSTQDFSCSIDAGSADFQQLECRGVSDIEVDLGQATLSGLFEKDVRLNVSTGSIELEAQRPAEYGYRLETGAGSIEIDGQQFSGFGMDQTYREDADILFDISCDLGEVIVDFTDSAAPQAPRI